MTARLRPHRLGLAYGLSTVALWLAVNAWMGAWSPELVEGRYALMAAPPPQAPWQLWGTSHVLHGLKPGRLDGRFQNLAFHSNNPSYQWAWYRMWRRHQAPPRLVLWGLDSFLLRRNALSRQFHQDAWAWPWGERVQVALRGGDRVFWQNQWPMIRWREFHQNDLLGIRRTENHYDRSQVDRGFFPYNAPNPHPAPPDGFQARWRPPLTGPGGLDVAQQDGPFWRDFHSTLDRLAAEGVRVVALQTPYGRPLSAQERAINGRLRRLLAARGIPFLNFNEEACSEINSTQAFYSDETHLNGRGAAYFSAFLRGFLKQRGLL